MDQDLSRERKNYTSVEEPVYRPSVAEVDYACDEKGTPDYDYGSLPASR